MLSLFIVHYIRIVLSLLLRGKQSGFGFLLTFFVVFKQWSVVNGRWCCSVFFYYGLKLFLEPPVGFPLQIGCTFHFGCNFGSRSTIERNVYWPWLPSLLPPNVCIAQIFSTKISDIKNHSNQKKRKNKIQHFRRFYKSVIPTS